MTSPNVDLPEPCALETIIGTTCVFAVGLTIFALSHASSHIAHSPAICSINV